MRKRLLRLLRLHTATDHLVGECWCQPWVGTYDLQQLREQLTKGGRDADA